MIIYKSRREGGEKKRKKILTKIKKRDKIRNAD